MCWPSTPALFWSRDAPEIWGIHVHGFDAKDRKMWLMTRQSFASAFQSCWLESCMMLHAKFLSDGKPGRACD